MVEHEIDDKKSAVPFTARLIAYYRAQESRHEDPLIIDFFAELLAGDMTSYISEHKRASGTSDYAVVRTHHIDNHVLAPWCDTHKQSQIVLLGAGLDARAYRINRLSENDHTVFEVDFDIVNSYKANILKDEKPYCRLVRVSTNLSEPGWATELLKAGYRQDIPTLWLLEGLVYYLEQNAAKSLLKTAAKICTGGSQIFTDVCVPGLTLAEYGPFMRHFKWGLNKEDVSLFFAHSGWNVSCAYADDHDLGRDVGQRGLIFVSGKRDLSKLGATVVFATDTEPLGIPESELQSYSKEFLMSIIPEIDGIIHSYRRNPEEGMNLYLDFIERKRSTLQSLIKSIGSVLSIGHISPRLLRDPAMVELKSPKEEEAHIVGYFKALLFLGYCGTKEIAGEQFSSTDIYSEGLKASSFDSIHSLVTLIQDEIAKS